MVISRIIKRLGYIIAGVIILMALLLSIARLSTPYLNHHLPDFETWSSRVLNAPVSIADVYISWDIYEPTLTFNQVKFLDKQNRKPKFQIEHAKINFNIFRSVFARTLIVESITISGAHVTINQTKTGMFNVEGLHITDNLAGGSANAYDVIGWIFSLPQLNLQNIDLKFLSLNG